MWWFNIKRYFIFPESTYEDEEQFARGGTTPGEGVVDEEDDRPGDGGMNSFPLKMTADITKGRITGVAGGFLRGARQHVNYDLEAPPPPYVAQQQTTCLLERPEIDKKVKVSFKVLCAHRIEINPFIFDLCFYME